MNFRLFLHITFSIVLLTACSTENDISINTPSIPSDKDWHEEIMDGASATVKGFEPGDAITRTSLVYDGQSLVFGWKNGDMLGLYPTAKDATNLSEDQKQGLLSQEDGPHPSLSQEPNLYRVNPTVAEQSQFACEETPSQTTRITNGTGQFMWDDIVRWTAYCQWKPQNEGKGENYTKRYFCFKDQKQQGLADLGEYFDYDAKVGNQDEHLNKYHLSEVEASKHLGQFDVLISPETKWVDGQRINFQMRHVGAIARLYLKYVEEGYVIKNVKLICDKSIFYEEGSFDLTSHPYNESESNVNYGVDLNRKSENCQIKPEGSATNVLQLDFAETCVTKKTGSGNYGPYVVAYLMMYPITYNPATDGNLYAYVTAYKQGEDPSKEKYFVSSPLAGKTMESGKYYQWNSVANAVDGLYPIELTATLLPWQDIVGGNINTDLEK